MDKQTSSSITTSNIPSFGEFILICLLIWHASYSQIVFQPKRTERLKTVPLEKKNEKQNQKPKQGEVEHYLHCK